MCPEPVLVKCSFVYINGTKSGVFPTVSIEVLVALLDISHHPARLRLVALQQRTTRDTWRGRERVELVGSIH